MAEQDGPPAKVLAAFGVTGRVQRFAGGHQGAWRGGGVVVKRAGLPEETAWRAEAISALREPVGFRIARPVRARDGGWTAFGWEASREVPGQPDPTRFDDVLRTGEAFHTALAGWARPLFLDVRDDAWSFGDRVAWQETSLDDAGPAWAAPLAALAHLRRPVDLPAQPVHGDLLGNVLFAPGLPPAVIDWPVYFRPTAWASAVAVVDALTWHDAPPALLDRWAHLAEWGQMLVRALIYRMATNEGLRRAGLPAHERPEDYDRTIGLVRARLVPAPAS